MAVIVLPRDVKWFVSEEGATDLAEVRSNFGDRYKASVLALRETLCAFFSNDGACTSKHGTAISPLGGVDGGGKLLKVRWLRPGSGRSGGLRLAFVAFCESRQVVLCRAWARKDDPGDEEFAAAGQLAGRYRADG